MKRFWAALLVLSLAIALSAKDIKRPDSYNYLRAEEAIENGEFNEALQYLQKELAVNPKNGYAYFRTAWINLQREENGLALSNIEKALRYLPKKDKEYIGFSHNLKANVFSNLGQNDKAVEELGLAIKAQPEDIDYLNYRGQKYYEMKKYDLSNADYLRVTKIEPGSIIGFLGLGRNAYDQKNFAEAEKNYDYALKLAPEESQCYCFRAECYIEQKKWNRAIEDLVKAVSIDESARAVELMEKINEEPQFSKLMSRLNTEIKKTPAEFTWLYIAGLLNKFNGKPQDAIPFFKKIIEFDENENIYYLMADTYSELGMYEKATESIGRALEEDSTNNNYHWEKAVIAHRMGDMKGSIAAATKMVKNAENEYFPYKARGMVMMWAELYDEAIDDFNTAVSIEPNQIHTYLLRGYCHTKQNNHEAARDDYEKVIETDTVAKTATEAMFAYAMLGDRDKAVEMCDSVLANENTQGALYNAACLYSRLNAPATACRYLQKVFDKGIFELAHIEKDFDMENIRNNEEFERIMNEQRRKQVETVAKMTETTDNTEYEEEEVEVPFTKEGSLCRVKCYINDLPLSFIFDTGASEVSMSMVEATFMMKNGYLGKNDVAGSANFLDANGNVNEGTIINLRNVNFGGLSLNNVRASVVRNQKAPLLLGQTVLNRVGKIEIDNINKVLKITHKIKK
ncbi:tetratricopeptide repeat protein [Prevotella sp. OH937_COT-195]|uniref:tetratricopeptide repeat protein n=1 Tax=Prevotella sp. OH937_COT-195 TaxID=2491051 RepID=UPI000F654984|nr:tetratricopeptide repeat protein [Prevotella sp. OH937_COT-195]RRD00253.1 aspartic protease [Prevotella sp. OH937_COT-195]